MGKIYLKSYRSCIYSIRSLDEISVLINYFYQYPLITIKHADYLLFKLEFEIIKNKQHLTEKGFKEILFIKASINKGLSGRARPDKPSGPKGPAGLSTKLKEVFPNITPYLRPNVNNIIIQNPN